MSEFKVGDRVWDRRWSYAGHVMHDVWPVGGIPSFCWVSVTHAETPDIFDPQLVPGACGLSNTRDLEHID